jgi:hypothetical protein
MKRLKSHLKGLALAFVLTVIAVGGYVVAAGGHGSRGWQPTAAQLSLAQQVAIGAAISMNPDGTVAAGPVDLSAGWPAYVQTAVFAASRRQDGIRYTDDATTDDNRDVLIIEMTGNFRAALPSVPRGVDPIVFTHGVTLVIDASTGTLLDESFEVSDRPLTNSASLKA